MARITDHIRASVFQQADEPAFLNKLNDWRSSGKKLVFTNGCFDIVHLGHVDYLSKAAELGDVLVVGLNTDVSVRRIKGPGRPITDESARAFILASFGFVDAVVMFEEDTPYSLIRTIQPDVLVKGSDYKTEDMIGHDIVSAKNGKVVAIELLEGYSTSNIIKKIRN
ncbi:MAG: D-glycero-beta-D-manno-heptose 1-phosphate adenylyltransferase [Bacteroidales bacterium]